MKYNELLATTVVRYLSACIGWVLGITLGKDLIKKNQKTDYTIDYRIDNRIINYRIDYRIINPWVTILIYSIAPPPHWNLCDLWPKNWQDKEKFHIFWPFFMNLTQFYPFFLNFDMILAYFSNITLKI